MKSKIHFIIFCFMFQLIGISKGYSQKTFGTLKLCLNYKYEKDPEIYLPGIKIYNGPAAYQSIGYEINFLKSNFLGVSTAYDNYGYFAGSNEVIDTNLISTLKGKYTGRSEYKYLDFYVGSRIKTFKKWNQSFNFSCGISRARGRNYFVGNFKVDTNYANQSYIRFDNGERVDMNSISPMIQVGYDLNLFKNWLNVGLIFRVRNYEAIGWQYTYGISFGHNFKKLYPHKEDFKSFADFMTVDKEDKARWSDVKDFKNTIQLEYSAPYISYWGFPLFRLNLPGISYQRNFSKHFFAKANFNFWAIPYSWNFEIHSLQKWGLWDLDSTKIFSSRNFKTISAIAGYRINISQFAKQNFRIAAGASFSWGINGNFYSDGNWGGKIVEYKSSFYSPLLEIEYNINPIKNHLNLGVHSRAKYYSDFGYEFDFGIHAGVNF